MSRIPLATDLKTRTGAPSTKDARQVNSYLETKGEQTAVRKRPSAQGGIAVGTGTAQGGIGLTIGGVPTFIGFWGDTMQTYSGSGTTWSSSTSYIVGDHVTVGFVDYWAVQDNSNQNPTTASTTYWSRNFVPRQATRSAYNYGWGPATACIPAGSGYPSKSARSTAFVALINGLACANGNGAYVYYLCPSDPDNQITYSYLGGPLVPCYAPSTPNYITTGPSCPPGYTYNAGLDACVLNV